ncbi:MAG: formyltetrahydrofolate deformylase [Candidatus Omnitrophota bacterium]
MVKSNAVLLISCLDQKGITAAVTDFVFKRGGNIVDAAQHADQEAGLFFMRMEWELGGDLVDREQIARDFSPLAEHFGMSWDLHVTGIPVNTAVFVSRQLHCLHDLLFRYKAGQLPGADIRLIVSNHEDAAVVASHWGIEFLHTPVFPETKSAAEVVQLSALQKNGVSLVILARYHQILTEDFIRHYPQKIINIHHSFLPAFAGGNPYAQAHRKGVKIIGATSHYVISALDEGPIIEQDTARINHRHAIKDLVEIGQDLERVVLYRAVRWHLERKILSCANKTVIFDT